MSQLTWQAEQEGVIAQIEWSFIDFPGGWRHFEIILKKLIKIKQIGPDWKLGVCLPASMQTHIQPQALGLWLCVIWDLHKVNNIWL